jgi:hypothetical protein
VPAVGDHHSIPNGWDQSAVTASLTNPNDRDTRGMMGDARLPNGGNLFDNRPWTFLGGLGQRHTGSGNRAQMALKER